MSTQRVPQQEEMHRESDSFTGGPGVVATKSQARGGLAGGLIGAVVGAVLGLIVGALFLGGGMAIAITTIVGAVAGMVALAVFGGIFNSARNTTPTSPADD